MIRSVLLLTVFFFPQGPLPLPLDVELLGEALEWFRRGEAMIGTESEHSEAQARCFREAVNLSPDFEQARYNLVLVLLAQEKFQEAEEQSFQLLVRKPDFTQAYIVRAEARLKMGKYSEALEDLVVFLKKYPKDSRGLELQGQAFLNQGNFPEAAAAYKRAGKPSEDSLGSGIIAGLSLLNSGKSLEAADVFSGLVSAFPEAWESYYWYGAALRDLGRLDEAVSILQKAEELNPGNEMVRKELTEVFLGLGDFGKAEIWIKRKKNKTASDYTNLALLAQAENNLKDVVACLEAASELDPENTSILAGLGAAQEGTGNTMDAVITYRRIIKSNPGDFNALLHLGGLLAKQGDLSDSREILEQAVSVEPESAEAFLKLAVILDKMEIFDLARKAYESHLGLGGKDLNAHFRLGFLLAEAGDVEGAISHLTAAVSGDPKAFVPVLIEERKKVSTALDSIRETAQFYDLLDIYKNYRVEEEKK